MPTGAEFEAAAAEFSAASGELQQLSADVRAIDSAAVVQGGRLGRLVPERLTTCAGQAASAAASAEAAAQVCRERAAIIAAYEARLSAYDAAMAAYEAQLNSFYLASSGWGSFFGGLDDPVVAAPVIGPRPRRPTAPTPPPAWADVRRL